jgi:ribosomal protein S18 acetylase RimI-like enzyme
MALGLREARPEDAALLRQLTLACWTGKVAADSSAFREGEEDVREDLSRGGGFLLFLDAKPIASVRWRAVPGAWEMARLGVLPEHRQAGHSQLLIEAVLARARASGAPEIRIGVRRDQPRLVEFYRALGFEIGDDFAYSHPNPLAPPPYLMRRKI